jgi:hypothetical protein
VQRKCLVIKSSKDYGSSFSRYICVDLENQEDIFACIQNKSKKFWYIVERILTQNFIYWDNYDKEKVSSATQDVTAIKFFDADNTRIYCREVNTPNGNFYVICSIVLFSKKVQKNDKRIVSIIETVASYEYEIIQSGRNTK